MSIFRKSGRPLLIILVILGIVFLIWKAYRTNNLGINDKTLWDWMELLIIPLALAVGVWWLDKSEKETEREINSDSQRQEQFNRYLENMTKLLLDKGLRESNVDAEIRIIARAQTLTVLRSLDLFRKAEVIRFLYEADLLNKSKPIINLFGANLNNVNFDNMNLSEISLVGVSLSQASLQNADLSGANLRWANISNCDFRNSNLSNCELNECTIQNSNFYNTDLSWASLDGADLRETKLSNHQIESIGSFERALLPKISKD